MTSRDITERQVCEAVRAAVERSEIATEILSANTCESLKNCWRALERARDAGLLATVGDSHDLRLARLTPEGEKLIQSAE